MCAQATAPVIWLFAFFFKTFLIIRNIKGIPLVVSYGTDRKLSAKLYSLTKQYNKIQRFEGRPCVFASTMMAISGISVQESLLETLNLVVSCRQWVKL